VETTNKKGMCRPEGYITDPIKTRIEETSSREREE
jgi:hypothetical protein